MLPVRPHLFSITIIFFCYATILQSQDQDEFSGLPQTVAEASEYKSTSLSKEVVSFVDACESRAEHINKFVFGKTVEGREMVGVSISAEPYQLGQKTDKAVVLVIGNIHSGECAGKEAILMMIRELALKPDHPWLQEIVLLMVPNYNADANDRVGKNNRPGQIGPENGMGRRENAQDLDLNRDFVKLESPEARAMIGLIDRTNPHLFIDCHTTNGSKHQYALTYDIPHNPATAEPIRNFLRQKMMPAVTKKLAEDGTLTFYYGNFNREHTSWTTYGHQPRYSTEYAGLRGRLAILSEAYSYITHKDRIFATKDFVSQCLNYVQTNADAIKGLLDAVDSDLERIANKLPSRISVSLNAKAVKFDEKFTLKGYKDDQPHDYECDFVGDYDSTRSVTLPYAYVIPKSFPRQVDRLLMHGVSVEELSEDTKLLVSINTIKQINRNERAFQKHRMVQATSQQRQEKTKIAKGSYIVRTAQPLGRLLAYMLECESDDGMVFWNFFDDALAVDKDYPVFRIDTPTEIKTKPVKKVTERKKVTLESFQGSNTPWSTSPAPRWVNNRDIEMRLNGRRFWMDAQSLSFSKMLQPKFDKTELREMLVAKGVSESAAEKLVEVKPLESKERDVLVFDGATCDCVFKPETDELVVIGNEENGCELFEFSPDQSRLAFVNNDGLNVMEVDSSKIQTLKVAHSNELIGKLDWVYQEELYGRGNFKGYWWCPDSQRIAFLKLDETAVAKFTITDHVPVRGKDEFLSYPKAGDPNPTVAIGIAAVDRLQNVTWIDLDKYEEEILISNVDWQPDGSKLIFQVQNRVQTFLDLVATESNGKSQVLFRDQTEAWIESPGNPQWLADGRFIWLSPRSGYRHLYLYGEDGKLEKQLTDGKWEVRSIEAFDKENGVVFFSAAKDKAYEMHVYRSEIDSGELKRITPGAGTHRVSYNESATHFIDSVSSFTSLPEHQLYTADGTFQRSLQVNSDDRWKYYDLAEPEFFEIRTSNDQPLDAMILKPADFDPDKKYPVLIHSYAGPQAPRVRDRWGGGWGLWHQALVNEGYIVFICDNQSASYRSSKYAWPIHQDLGRNELVDIERGVDWLKQQAWVDGERIGIWGWSYGGYITTYALTHSDSFKIGIAGAPVTDWRNYDTIYTERLMGLPQENLAGYEASSIVREAANLSGELLLIHGTIDDNVHLSNSMQLILELQKAGKQFHLMVYPENRHAVRKQPQSSHLRRLMLEFVLGHL